MTSNQFAVCLPMHRKCRLFFACRLQPICQRLVFENWFFCLFEREREKRKRKKEMLSLLFSCVSPNAPNVPIYAWLGFGACLPVSLLLCLYIVNLYSMWRHPLIMWFLFAPPLHPFSCASCAPLHLNSLGPTFVFSRAHCILQILTLNFTPVFWSKTFVFVNSFDSRTKSAESGSRE
jgi:hypothetical protein